jgi:polar amino acid transport system substrate-binding protein
MTNLSSLILLLILLWSTPALSDSNKVIHLSQGSGLGTAGFLYKVQLAILKSYQNLGYKTEVHSFPGLRALSLTEHGKFDGDMMRIKEVSNYYPHLIPVPVPLITGPVKLYYRASKFNDQYKFSKKDVVGFFQGTILVKVMSEKLNFLEAPSYESLEKIFLLGRVDAFLSSAAIESVKVRKMIKSGVIKSRVLREIELFHFVHKKNEHLIPLLVEEFKKTILPMVEQYKNKLKTN